MALCTIGIDIGSTSSKAVLFDLEQEVVLRVESNSLRPAIPDLPVGWHEEAPVPLREAGFDLIERLAKYAETFGHKIRAICFTGQMHGGLIVDQRLGPLSNFVTWQDKRGDEIVGGKTLARSIQDQISSHEREAIGTELHTGFLGVTAASWVAEDRMPSHAKIIGIYDWIASSVAQRLVSDRSSVAAWGLYNIRDLTISLEAVDACGLLPAQLPEIMDIGEIIGSVSADGALGHLASLRQCLVVAGAGDTQASYVGSGCSRNEILLNFGTGSQLMIESDHFDRYWGTDSRYLGEEKYLIVAPTLAGGKSYEILADFFIDVLQSFDIDVRDRRLIYERMNELARSASNGITFVPHFLGSRTHGEDRRAMVQGLDADNFRTSHLIRALLEGMIEEVHEAFRRLPAQQREREGLVVSGNGMLRNAALRTVAEQAFGLPLRQSTFVEEAARGAAIIAARAIN